VVVFGIVVGIVAAGIAVYAWITDHDDDSRHGLAFEERQTTSLQPERDTAPHRSAGTVI
jgi:hypothetical protein